MKSGLKKLYSLIGQLFRTITSLICVLLFSSIKGDSHFKKQRKKRKHNEQCHVLCNGPSLSSFLEVEHSDLENVFVVNYFATTEQYLKYKPNNYIILDNIEIGRATVTDKQREHVLNLYNTIVSKTTWPLTFYYPSNGVKEFPNILKKNTNITVVIYNMTPISGFKGVSHWLFRHSLGMPLPQNISNAAVFCALNAGFKKIYLYGVDHSWIKSFDIHPETHRMYMNDGHFYEKENIRWFNRGAYRDWLYWTYLALQSHFELREYADSINAKIINKTPASFIEAYEFDEY